MTQTDEEAWQAIGFSAQDSRLIVEELRAIRAELRATIVETARPARGAEFDPVDLICTVRTPAQMLADHERRIAALETKG